MGFGLGAGFAGVGGEQPGDILGLFERNLAGHDAQEEVREGVGVLVGEFGERTIPEGVGGGGEVVAFEDGRLAVRERKELELVVVGDEAEPVGGEIPAHLGRLREGGEAGAGGFDFDGTALWKLAGKRLSLRAAGEREEAAIDEACAVGAGVGLEMNARLEAFADYVEEIGERGVEGGFSGVSAERVGGTHGGDVLLDGAG